MHRWILTIGCLAISGLAGCEKANVEVEPPTVITVNKENSDIPRFTVVLPANWKLRRMNSRQTETFVFLPKGAEFPYMWIRIKNAGADSRPEQLKSAASEYQPAEILSEGELATMYFDPRRDLLWNRVETSQDLTIVTAELIHEENAVVRFTDKRAQMRKSKQTVVDIISHIKFYGENPPEFAPDSAADIGIDPEIFARQRQRKFSLLWFYITTVGVLVLALINFELSRRRKRAVRAEIDEAVEIRQKAAKLAVEQLPEADDYIRKTLRTRNLQRGDDSG